MKGSSGYLNLEYFGSHLLTEKSDVYPFGVVLVEVLCGKPALDHGLPTEKINLAAWVLRCEGNGELYQILDPNLYGNVKAASVKKDWELAKKCLAERRINRPPMDYVSCSLEDALHSDLKHNGDTMLGDAALNCGQSMKNPRCQEVLAFHCISTTFCTKLTGAFISSIFIVHF